MTGEIYSFARQRTLFNLYAFSKLDSYQDFKGRFSAQDCSDEDVPCKEYVNPSLTLLNVEARNFLYDYDSLVHIENDNIIIQKDQPFLLGNTNAGANIKIESSVFIDCSFCHGMVDYRDPLDIDLLIENDRFFSYMNNSYTKT